MALNFGTPVARLSTVGKIPQPFRTTLNQGIQEYASKYPWVFGTSLDNITVFGREPSDQELAAIPGYLHDMLIEGDAMDDVIRDWRGPDVIYGQSVGRRILLSTYSHLHPSAKTLNKDYAEGTKPWTVGHSYGVAGFRNTFRHEFGHHFASSAVTLVDPTTEGNEAGQARSMVKNIFPTVASHFKLNAPEPGNELAQIRFQQSVSEALQSGYASTDPHELMAELFTRSEVRGPGHQEARGVISEISGAAAKRFKMLQATETAASHLLDMRRL